MIKNDKVYGKPLVLFTETKANIEAMTGLAEGSTAYATDTNQLGTYNGSVWFWMPLTAWGSMYQDDSAHTITVSATNTDYIVDGMTDDVLNNVTFQDAQELVITIAGVYQVNWSVAFTCTSANQEIEGAVGRNGIRQPSTSTHNKILTGADTTQMSATGLLALDVDDLVQIVIRNETSTANIEIEHANLSLVYLGPAVTVDSLLLESGDDLLLESGDMLLME